VLFTINDEGPEFQTGAALSNLRGACQVPDRSHGAGLQTAGERTAAMCTTTRTKLPLRWSWEESHFNALCCSAAALLYC
jgi:hypothetical protein